MAAFSARDDDSNRLSPPMEVQNGAPLDDSPTVISSDPLSFDEQCPPASGTEQVPDVEIASDEEHSLNQVPSTHSYALAEPGLSAEQDVLGDRGPSAPVFDRTVISKRPPIADLQFGQPYTPHELGQALAGKQLAHFQLEEFLGGGMGAVFRGRDLTLSRSVAVKVLPRGQDEDTIRRFKNEAQSAARLNHENIARVYYIGEEDGWNFIIFEHIEGPTIRQLVDEQGPLSLDEAIHHTLQAAQALEHAYRRDVVHRDIKPSNLIVSAEGSTKLVDMGLARLHQVEASKNDLTASGVTLGTFDYISPEQARDPRSADVRSDLYSLGCTLYFMLAGRPPFPEGTVLQKLLDHQSRQPPDLRLFRPDLPEEAVAVINKLLAKQPEDRYQTPAELIADLAMLCDRLELAPVEMHNPVLRSGAASRSLVENHLVWIAPTMLLIGAVLVAEWMLRTPVDSDGGFKLPPIVAPTDVAAQPFQGGAEIPPSPPMEMLADVIEPKSSSADDSGVGAASDRTRSASRTHPRDRGAGAQQPTAANRDPTSDRSDAAAETAAARATTRTAGGNEGGSPTPANAASARAPSSRSPRIAASEPASQSVRTVVVGSKVGLPEDAAWVETADEALRQVNSNKWPELETIELRFTGIQSVRPLTLARSHLTIRAGQEHLPVLAFEGGAGYALEKHMIRVQGGQLSVEGVQLRWRLPVDRTPRDWALFLLDDVKGLILRRCVLTIENVDANGFAQENGAAFVRLASSTINQRAMQQAPQLAPPEVSLGECIVRGEADLIAATEVEAFELAWSQGLLATTERLADVGGASLERTGAIRIKLDHVTAATEEGLCRLVSNERAPYQLHLTVEADNCLFNTEPGAPLIEHETQNEIARLKAQSDWGRLLQWMGSNNVRVQGDVVWRIDDAANVTPVEFRPNDTVWAGLSTGGVFADYDLAWINQGAWAPQMHDRTVESYEADVRRAPDADTAETPGFRVVTLPPIYREGVSN